MLVATFGPRRPINGFVAKLVIYFLLAFNLMSPSMTFLTYPLPARTCYPSSRAPGSRRLKGKALNAFKLFILFICLIGMYTVSVKQIMLSCGRCPKSNDGPSLLPFLHPENPIKAQALEQDLHVAIPIHGRVPAEGEPFNPTGTCTFIWIMGRYALFPLNYFP
jgi:hypothetical protein